ncbi:MAG: hypothetical protein KZQ60_09675, partial [Candidatus Thiodiazotropha sp. (ex Lucinoma aequizonata)]|nr:hypothetical protein [Candidatus Thiodiazotropha sp. (ex Lucinoma aequizonata)]
FISPFRSPFRPYNRAYAYRGLTAFVPLSMALSGRDQSRGRLWHHQYIGGPNKPGTDSCRQPRALACGKLSLHH